MADDGWGTWNPDRPAELGHLASGFTLTPTLYSDRGARFSAIPSGEGFRFGERGVEDHSVAFRTSLEDTVLDWRYAVREAGVVTLEWCSVSHGEWGLRFWVNLCVHGPPGCAFVYDRETGTLRGEGAAGATPITVRAAKDPLLATFHEGLPSLAKEFERHGYFYLASRGTQGHFAVLRFNLEEAPSMRVAVVFGECGRPALPSDRAPPAPAEERPDPPVPQRGLQAIHDVMAWNHVYDRINERPYTCLTRNWNTQKFGGFGVWMDDVLYNGLLWSHFDGTRARQNIEAVFAGQTEDGNFPCLVTGNDAWLDRSQPPVASFAVWVIGQRARDRGFLAWAYPRLLENHEWWWRRRMLADTGLVAYGTSLDVGDGLYKGTKLAAKDESSMDNMPVHDPAPFNARTGLIEACDVGLNSLLAVDGEVLAMLAAALGHDDDAARLEERGEAHRARIGEWLWDDARGVFANRLLTGEFVEPLAPTSFFPLAAGAASAAQVQSLVERYLMPREKFGGDFGLPSVTRDHPAYHDNVYWRGRVWGPLNFWVHLGLVRAGRDGEAADLADMSFRLFAQGWDERLCGENYNAETGAIRDQADTDAFYAWGTLLAQTAVAQVTDVTPWRGTSLAPSRLDGRLGPVRTPLGHTVIEAGAGEWAVELDGDPFLRGDLPGEMHEMVHEPGEFSARLPATARAGWLEFPGRALRSATLEGADIGSNGSRLVIAPGAAGRRLRVAWFAPGSRPYGRPPPS